MQNHCLLAVFRGSGQLFESLVKHYVGITNSVARVFVCTKTARWGICLSFKQDIVLWSPAIPGRVKLLGPDN